MEEVSQRKWKVSLGKGRGVREPEAARQVSVGEGQLGSGVHWEVEDKDATTRGLTLRTKAGGWLTITLRNLVSIREERHGACEQPLGSLACSFSIASALPSVSPSVKWGFLRALSAWQSGFCLLRCCKDRM